MGPGTNQTTRCNVPNNLSTEHVALFWDYENVPIPRKGGERFLHALRHFFALHPLKYGRIYVHAKILSEGILQEIRKIGHFKVKWVMAEGPNTADRVMIQSARDLVSAHSQLSALIFITGDGHFKTLLREIGSTGAKKVLICGRGNYNWHLFEEVSHVCSTSYLMNHPEDWWMTSKQRCLVINRRDHPLLFCATCESLLRIRRKGNHYESWCPACKHRAEMAHTYGESTYNQLPPPEGKYIAL